MKKTHPPLVSTQSMWEATRAMPSPPAHRVADYVRTGMATIYKNDKATENEVADLPELTRD